MAYTGVCLLLQQLDHQSLLRCLAFLSPKDLLTLQKTCKDLRDVVKTSDVLWQPLLQQRFGLRFQLQTAQRRQSKKHKQAALQNCRSLAVYTDVCRGLESQTPLRFQGLSTDGGVDSNLMTYW